MKRSEARDADVRDPAERLHRLIVVVIVTIMAIDLVFIVTEAQWLNAFLILAIAGLILAPTFLGQRHSVYVPYEFQLVSLGFVFAALFLGEIRSYYDRFWWWDIVLHTTSGLLLGIFGFLLVFVLNESRHIHLSMRPRFVSFFAFLFAVATGAIWEIFEFSMDRILGTRMQKPMLGDPSGLTDTMWDLIVDSIGALAIATLGWWYMARERRSFIDDWTQKFIDKNPRLFHR